MNSSQQKILRKSQVETSDVSGRNEPSSYAMLQEVTISDGSVSCVRNKQFDHECSQPKSTTEWGVQILNELHAMGIEILKFTERDFGARLSRKRETTLRERTTELLTVLGMTAYAISQNRLWDLGCELGNQLGRWIHKDANIPGLGLEVAYGYSPQLGSARGKIVLVAIQRKFTAHDLTRYINECGGLDKAVCAARHALADTETDMELGKAETGGIKAVDRELQGSEGTTKDQIAAGVEDNRGAATLAETRDPEDKQEAPTEEGEDPRAIIPSEPPQRTPPRNWQPLPWSENSSLAVIRWNGDRGWSVDQVLTIQAAAEIVRRAQKVTRKSRRKISSEAARRLANLLERAKRHLKTRSRKTSASREKRRNAV